MTKAWQTSTSLGRLEQQISCSASGACYGASYSCPIGPCGLLGTAAASCPPPDPARHDYKSTWQTSTDRGHCKQHLSFHACGACGVCYGAMQCPTCELLQKAPVGCQGRLQLHVHNQVLSCSQVKDRPTCPSDAASPTLAPKNEARHIAVERSTLDCRGAGQCRAWLTASLNPLAPRIGGCESQKIEMLGEGVQWLQLQLQAGAASTWR